MRDRKLIIDLVPPVDSDVLAVVRAGTMLGATVAHFPAGTGHLGDVVAALRDQSSDLVLGVGGDASGPASAFAERPDLQRIALTGATAAELVEERLLRLDEREIKPVLEVTDAAGIELAKRLIETDRLRPPWIFHVRAPVAPTDGPEVLRTGRLLHELPTDSVWTITGVGVQRGRLASLAILAGGHVQVEAPGTIEAVKRIVDKVRALGREIASPAETRELLGLPPSTSRR